MADPGSAATETTEVELLDLADRLDREHRCLAAIEVLQAANRDVRSPRVEERLVELRRDAVDELDFAADPPQPQFEDPFPGRTALIEVPAAEVTPEVVGGAIQHHGCILVRGLLRPAHVDLMKHHIDRAFDALERAHEGADPEALKPWYVPLADNPNRPTHNPTARAYLSYMRVCAIDSPRAMFDLIEAYEDDGIHDIIRALLGTRPLMTGQKWALRKMTKRKMTFWHQEASVFARASTKPPNLRTVNVWMALSEAGTDAPGFDVLPRRETEIHPTKDRYSITYDLFHEVRDREWASPVYGPGDAMIFDEMLLHRTDSNQKMTGTRHSIESWFFSPGGLPERDAIVL